MALFDNFITQTLKSKHLAIAVFSGQRVFWGNERKYFPHIPGLTILVPHTIYVRVPGVHFPHVNLHFFEIFLSSHMPFFLCFLHFFVFILSLQTTLWIEFSSPEMYVSKTCAVLRTRLNWELSESSHNEKNITINYYFLITKEPERFRFEIDFWKSNLSSDLGSFWQSIWKPVSVK